MTDLKTLRVWSQELYRRSNNSKAHFAVIGTDSISRVLQEPFDTPEAAVTYGQTVLQKQLLARAEKLAQVPMWRVLQVIQEPVIQ